MTRNNDDFINGTYVNNPGGSNFTVFHGTGENALGTQSGAVARVVEPEGEFLDYNQLQNRAERWGESPFEHEAAYPPVRDAEGNRLYEGMDENGFAVGATHGRDRKAIRQGVLFEDSRKPPKVELLLATKDSRHVVPSLLEAANKEAQRTWGQNIAHSDNLSEFSRPVVNRLIRAGLSEGPEIEETGNRYDWVSAHSGIQDLHRSSKTYWDDDATRQLDPAEFQQGGRDFVKRLTAAEKARGITKGPKQKISEAISGVADKAASRVEAFQQSLPGLENVGFNKGEL